MEESVYNLKDLSNKFPHQWLAVRVLKREPVSGQPVQVEVVTRNADIYSIRLELGKEEHCILYTGPIPEDKYIAMF